MKSTFLPCMHEMTTKCTISAYTRLQTYAFFQGLLISIQEAMYSIRQVKIVWAMVMQEWHNPHKGNLWAYAFTHKEEKCSSYLKHEKIHFPFFHHQKEVSAYVR